MARLKRDGALAKLVGERVRAARVALGCSQAGLARLLGMRPGIIYVWETGAALPSCTTLPHLCRALRVSADYLLGLDRRELCLHEERREGPRVPLRYGSSPTDICCACGMYRLTLHVPGPWRPSEELRDLV